MLGLRYECVCFFFCTLVTVALRRGRCIVKAFHHVIALATYRFRNTPVDSHDMPMKSTFDSLMSRLRMRQIQLLIALDDHVSLHKAASAMAMTQSAASKALGEVEAMLGESIFERSKQGMVPNPFGCCVIRYARLLASDVSALCREVADIRSGTGGRLAIGAIMGAIPDCVVPAVDALQRRYPGLAVEIVEDTSANMLPLLDDGRLDVVVGRATVSPNPAKYLYQAVADEPLSVVVGAMHPPFNKEKIGFADLLGHRWIHYTAGMPMHELLHREMDLAGMTVPTGAITTASTFVTVTLLQGSAELVSILPTAVASVFTEHGMLRILPISFQSRSETFGVVTRKAGLISPIAQQLIGSLMNR